MPAYEIFNRCNEHKREIPILMKIHLEQGPDRKQGIAEFYRRRSMPSQVSSILGHNA
jgi:hypothetical protein